MTLDTLNPMHAHSRKALLPFLKRWGWAMVLLGCLLLGGILYQVESPETLGADSLAMLPRGVWLAGLLLAGVLYISLCLNRPVWLLAGLLIFWPYIAGIQGYLAGILGLYPPIRPLMLMGFGIPAVWIVLSSGKKLVHHWQETPWVWAALGYAVFATGYYLFYNAHTVPRHMVGAGSLGGGDYSITMLYAALVPVIGGVVMSGVITRFHRQKTRLHLPLHNVSKTPTEGNISERVFHQLHHLLLWVSALAALWAVVGYPFQWTSRPIDGFLRAYGLFFHPNGLAHHQGMLLCYLSGYVGWVLWQHIPLGRQTPSPVLQPARSGLTWVLLAYGLNLLAFVLAFSKGAFLGVGIAALVILAMLLPYARWRQLFWQFGPGVGLGILSLPVVYWLVSGQSLWEQLMARIEDAGSYHYREKLWAILANAQEPGAWLWGHGLTASNQVLLQHNFHAGGRPIIDVHNGYIQLVFDMGLPGLLLILAMVLLAGAMGTRMFKLQRLANTVSAQTPLGQKQIQFWLGQAAITAGCLGMAVYLLVTTAFDEMIQMYALLLWGMILPVWVTLTFPLPSAGNSAQHGEGTI